MDLEKTFKADGADQADWTQTQAEWNERYAATKSLWSTHPNQSLVEEVATLRPQRVLDLAAGEGRNSLWLADLGCKIHAIDLSDIALDKAQQLAEQHGISDNIEFEVADLRHYSFEASQYDLVICMFLHLPWPEMESIFQRACTSVAPGGTLLVIGHDKQNIENGFGGPQNPDILYTADEVAASLAKVIEIEKTSLVRRRIQSNNQTKTALDCLVRAFKPALDSD